MTNRYVFAAFILAVSLFGFSPAAGYCAAANGLLMSGAGGGKPERLAQVQFQVPVLKNKPGNPVLRLQLDIPSARAGDPVSSASDPALLSGITLDLNGTTRLADLKKIKIYYGGVIADLPDLESDAAPLFASALPRKEQLELQGELLLAPGTHYFWVTLDLEPTANIDHYISVAARSVQLNRKTLVVPPVKKPLRQRIGVAVRQHGQDGIHTARIPGLATTNKGTLLAIFDARHDSSRDLQGDIDIGLHRSTDGGASWEPLRIVLDKGEWGGLPEKFNGVSDACILVDDNTGAIYIAGLWMHGVINRQGEWIEDLDERSDAWNHQWRNKGSQPGYGVKQTSQFLLIKSTDDGRTWSRPRNLTRMGKKEAWWLWAPAPGRGITLEDGTLVFPTQGRDASGKGFSTITYSKDGGNTWTTGNPATGAVKVSTAECAVAQLSDGSLMLNMRSGENNKGNTGSDNGRIIAISSDMGATWKEHPGSAGALPEPACMASLYKHRFQQDGRRRSVLLFSNPASKTQREELTVKASLDDGRTWPREYQVLLDEWRGRGYSCLTSVGAGYIGILYESSRADLVFQRIPITDILN